MKLFPGPEPDFCALDAARERLLKQLPMYSDLVDHIFSRVDDAHFAEYAVQRMVKSWREERVDDWNSVDWMIEDWWPTFLLTPPERVLLPCFCVGELKWIRRLICGRIHGVHIVRMINCYEHRFIDDIQRQQCMSEAARYVSENRPENAGELRIYVPPVDEQQKLFE